MEPNISNVVSYEKLSVSIITVVFNNVYYIRDTLESVISQDYPLIEYIVIDGDSTDGTLDVIEKYRDHISVFSTESDDGIYDALNKGIALASGDVIAILHSDDLFCDKCVVSDMMKKMSETNAEFCFSDMVIVNNISDKIVRYYKASYFRRWMFRMGWMPPHPTCFIKKSLFDEFGMYSLVYRVAGDFDFIVRMFYGREINWAYLSRITVKMRKGGVSNSGFESKKIIANEINQSLRANNVWSLPFFQLGRYFIRLMEILAKPNVGHSD
jgi:glycosyltransferase involved in cell wall biosynthesis